MKKLFTKKEKQKGFTLLETIVACLVLMIALNAMLTLISSSIFSARYSKNEITAMYLAQEAIDRVRNDRDSMAFLGSNFLTFYGYDGAEGQKCFSVNGCQFNVTDWDISANIIECNAVTGEDNDGCSPLYYNDDALSSNENYYTYSYTGNETETTFRRKISMQTKSVGSDPDVELIVRVTIDWKNGGLPHSRTLTTSLLKWQ